MPTKNDISLISIIFFIVFVSLGYILYQTTGASSIKSMVEQMLHREQVIARSGAASITSFVDMTSRSLLILSNNNINSEVLNTFTKNWSGTPVVGIIFTDTKGEIKLVASNSEDLSSGGNVSNRDYFIEASKSPNNSISIGKPFISRVPGANQTTYKIPIATPVFSNNKFIGVLAVSISIPSLADKYLNSLKISSRTGIFLISSNGDFLNGSIPETADENIFQLAEEHPFLGDKIIIPMIRQKLALTQETKLDIAIPDFTTEKITRTLIASSPTNLSPSMKSMLVVTTPLEDALIFISPFMFRNIILVIVIYIISITISLFVFSHFIKK